jgi:hypothetical protein
VRTRARGGGVTLCHPVGPSIWIWACRAWTGSRAFRGLIRAKCRRAPQNLKCPCRLRPGLLQISPSICRFVSISITLPVVSVLPLPQLPHTSSPIYWINPHAASPSTLPDCPQPHGAANHTTPLPTPKSQPPVTAKVAKCSQVWLSIADPPGLTQPRQGFTPTSPLPSGTRDSRTGYRLDPARRENRLRSLQLIDDQ